jgi:hypothetical protein
VKCVLLCTALYRANLLDLNQTSLLSPLLSFVSSPWVLVGLLWLVKRGGWSRSASADPASGKLGDLVTLTLLTFTWKNCDSVLLWLLLSSTFHPAKEWRHWLYWLLLCSPHTPTALHELSRLLCHFYANDERSLPGAHAPLRIGRTMHTLSQTNVQPGLTTCSALQCTETPGMAEAWPVDNSRLI